MIDRKPLSTILSISLILVTLLLSTSSVVAPARGLVVGVWSASQVVSSESTLENYSPSLRVAENGTVHVAWWELDVSWSYVWYRRHVPSTGWTTREKLSETSLYAYLPSLGLGEDDAVHVAWADRSGSIDNSSEPVIAMDDVFYRGYLTGTGWTSREVVSVNSSEYCYTPSLAATPDGTIHVAWTDDTDYLDSGGDLDIFYRRYVPGLGWGAIELVSTVSTESSGDPCLAVGDQAVHITWTEDNGQGSDIMYSTRSASSAAGGVWSTAERVSTQDTGYSTHSTIDIGSGNIAHVAWEWRMPEENPGDIYYRHATASGWTQTELVSTNSPRESSEPSLAVDSDGHVHIAWQDETRFETYFGTVGLPYRFNIYYRKYQPDSGWSQRVAITKNSLYAANPCVDAGPDDTVHIAWDEAHIVNNQVRHDVFYKYYTTIEISPLSYADPVRKTAIIVDPVNKLFQFTGSRRVYPMEEADMMLVHGDSITILDRSETLLLTAQINTWTGLCIAIARDRQTGNVYWLITRPGSRTG